MPHDKVPEDKIYTKLDEKLVRKNRLGEYQFLGYTLWSARCCVCNTWGKTLSESSCTDENLDKSHVIYNNGYYYIVNSEHEACRELFLLNPLAYETP